MSTTTAVSSARKGTRPRILNYLVRSRKSIWLYDLPELIGVSERKTRLAVRQLQGEKVITVRSKPGNRKLVSIKPEIKQALLEELKERTLRAEKPVFLGPVTDQNSESGGGPSKAIPHKEWKPISKSSLLLLFNNNVKLILRKS